VTPGEPVTAQGWNALVSGLSSLYDAVIAMGGGTLEVLVTAPSERRGPLFLPDLERILAPIDRTRVGELDEVAVPDEIRPDIGGREELRLDALRALASATTRVLEDAVVVAEPLGEGRAVAALPPFGERTAHLLVGLTDGPWRIHVSVPGMVTQTRDVTMPQTDPIGVSMVLDGVRVPDLFGVGARAALDQLRSLGIDADALLDTNGREVSRLEMPPEYVDVPVLHQLPEAGTVVPAGSGRVRLVVASALRRDPVVTMPSLVGLTLSEAQQVLERLGLVLGKSDVRS
jgi:hypothetical protein